MSIRVMAQIFDIEGLGPTHRLILLALADHADDTGRCYPSIDRLCRRTGLAERAMQTNLKALDEAGYVKIERNAGPRGCNVYTVCPTPAADAPPQEMHPAADAPPPPHLVRPTPAADAPEPSKNHHLTVNDAQRARFTEFWDRVPQKVGKANAEKAWKKLKPPDQAAALEAVSPFYAWWRRQHPDASWLHPSTYLNQKRWEDDAWRSTPQQPTKLTLAQRINRQQEARARRA